MGSEKEWRGIFYLDIHPTEVQVDRATAVRVGLTWNITVYVDGEHVILTVVNQLIRAAAREEKIPAIKRVEMRAPRVAQVRLIQHTWEKDKKEYD